MKINNLPLHRISALTNNYIWLYQIDDNVIVVDPGDAELVIHYCSKQQLTPIAILITHHHSDHTDGIKTLCDYYTNIDIFAPDEVNFPHHSINFERSIMVQNKCINIIQTPGHTLQHVSYLIDNMLFCGDTLFSGGCGRIFEGTSQLMFHSLNTLRLLPDETLVCAAHEYTLNNLQFAHTIDPNNTAISTYLNEIEQKTSTLPSTIKQEKKINLFFMNSSDELKKRLNVKNDLDLFTQLRLKKDIY